MSIELLSPELVGQLGRLDLVARLVVEGFLTGLHKSPYHGFSAEFAEYRQYIPGESVANIDWRAYAKSDRHYLKVFTEETNLRATILMDCSSSMDLQPQDGGLSKKAYASYLASALTYLLLRQNDGVGLVTFAEKPLQRIPVRSMRKQLFQILKILDALPRTKGAGTATGEVLHQIADQVHRRGMIVLFSDLLNDDAESIMGGLKHLRHRGHEILVFAIMDPRESAFDYQGEIEFVSLENPDEKIRLDADHSGPAVRERIQAKLDHLQRECRRHRIDLVPITTDTPFEKGLGQYLQKRRRLY